MIIIVHDQENPRMIRQAQNAPVASTRFPERTIGQEVLLYFALDSLDTSLFLADFCKLACFIQAEMQEIICKSYVFV